MAAESSLKRKMLKLSHSIVIFTIITRTSLNSSQVQYAKSKGLGGVSASTVDLDDFKGLCGDKWPLLQTVNSVLTGKFFRFKIPFALIRVNYRKTSEDG